MIDDYEILNRRVFSACFSSAKYIVFVGNGPTDAADQVHIDNADIVVRFNNWGSRNGLVHNVSRRCDMVFLNGDCHTTNIGKEDVGAPKAAIMAIPYPHHAVDGDRLLSRFYPQALHAQVHPFWLRDLCKHLGYKSDGTKHPLPTVGLVGMYMLHKIVPDVNFYVCGFSWHFDPATDQIQKHSFDQDPLPTHFNHWYVRELVYICRRFYCVPHWRFSSIAVQALNRVHNKQFSWEKTWPLTP